MSVVKAYLDSNVYMLCMAHALSSEKDEVMGLLLGYVDIHGVSHIKNAKLLRRTTKRKDRVEISPLQLIQASTEAEEYSKKNGEVVRIVGWYHSHPHITVYPSHIDIATQACYQQMDPMFVGLIFSVFNEDKAKTQTVETSCFQAQEDPETGAWHRRDIELCVQATNFRSNFASLASVLVEEEQEMFGEVKNTHVLSKVQNVAAHMGTLACILDIVSLPVLSLLKEKFAFYASREELERRQLAILEREIDMLEKRLSTCDMQRTSSSSSEELLNLPAYSSQIERVSEMAKMKALIPPTPTYIHPDLNHLSNSSSVSFSQSTSCASDIDETFSNQARTHISRQNDSLPSEIYTVASEVNNALVSTLSRMSTTV